MNSMTRCFCPSDRFAINAFNLSLVDGDTTATCAGLNVSAGAPQNGHALWAVGNHVIHFLQ